MKDWTQKVISFIAFEFATDRNCLSQQFNATHVLYQKDILGWSTNATKQNDSEVLV
ncbi:MAG: hypothetical protein JWQ09_1927 [Segetibacter sp.]|nr:hypothetical protein [Segetibacter sp.]